VLEELIIFAKKISAKLFGCTELWQRFENRTHLRTFKEKSVP